MANPWFRLYAEFATDPKVQMLSEADQRRLVMILCLRCNGDVTLHDEEIAFQLRITMDDWTATKAVFVAKKFIDDDNNVLNWDKRQYVSDSSSERVARHREKKKQACNVTVTPPDTDTDTDTEKSSPLAVNLKGGAVAPQKSDDLVSLQPVQGTAESVPLTPATWFTFFNERYGQNFKHTSIHDRKALWPIFTRWVDSGITERQVVLAINKAMAEAKSPISNLPAYVDRVLASMNSPPTHAQAKSAGIAASLGLVADTSKVIVEEYAGEEKARLPNH